jgi:AraC-like DNA-binding protein
MGCSLWQYVLRQRVRIAEGLMTDRALTLTQVATMSGFESYSAFAASFKSQRNMSPASFRTALA